MSRRKVYDNWEKLVNAVIKREDFKRLALCPSFSTVDSSSRFSFDTSLENLSAASPDLHLVSPKLAVTDIVDKVWIPVCYDVVFEEKVDGGWTWKHKGDSRANVLPLLVTKTISYIELYDKVRGVLDIDNRLQQMEFATLVPGMSNVPIPPLKIDCDNNVSWYISVCREVPLCVTILTKEVLEDDNNRSAEDASSSAHGDRLLMSTNDVVEKGDTDSKAVMVHNQENHSHLERRIDALQSYLLERDASLFQLLQQNLPPKKRIGPPLQPNLRASLEASGVKSS